MAASSAQHRLGIGFKADGTHALDYYRPSVLDFSADCTKPEIKAQHDKDVPLEVSIPIPSGMALRKAKNQLRLAVSETHALRLRRVYG